MDPPNAFKQLSTETSSGSPSSSSSPTSSSPSSSSSGSPSSSSSPTSSSPSSSSSGSSSSSSSPTSSSPSSSSSGSSPSSSSPTSSSPSGSSSPLPTTVPISSSSSDSSSSDTKSITTGTPLEPIADEVIVEQSDEQEDDQIYEPVDTGEEDGEDAIKGEDAIQGEGEEDEDGETNESLKIGKEEEFDLGAEDIDKEPITSPSEEEDTDKLKIFYYLKNKYEMDKRERCNQKILKDTTITSIKRKRRQFASCRPKCINCKRRVGSIFSIKFEQKDDSKYRKFIAKCGDADKPCPFNIEMHIPNVLRLDDEYLISKKELDSVQQQIIIAKNKAVFGIIEPEDAVNMFDELKVAIDKHAVLMERNITRLAEVTHNLDNQEDINKKRIEFSENVSAFKVMMSSQSTKSASEFYANVLVPSAFDLSNLKFAHREVINDGSTSVCTSFDYLPSDLEIQSEINVINFNIGTVDTNPPEPIVPNPQVSATKRKTNTKTNRTSPKNKTVRKTVTKDITHVLDEVFQTLVIEDTLATIKPSQLYKLIEDNYKIPDVKDNYRSIIKNYLSVRMEEWVTVRENIIEVAHDMMLNGIPRGHIIEQLKLKRRQSTDTPIQYEKYKRIIDETLRRYEILLDSIADADVKPKPDWPPAI